MRVVYDNTVWKADLDSSEKYFDTFKMGNPNMMIYISNYGKKIEVPVKQLTLYSKWIKN